MSKYVIPDEVSANPNLVDFPTDDGICADLQNIGLLTAQRIYDEDQLDRLMCVYGILIKHTRALAARNIGDRERIVEQARIDQEARDKAIADEIELLRTRELKEAQARVAQLLGQEPAQETPQEPAQEAQDEAKAPE